MLQPFLVSTSPVSLPLFASLADSNLKVSLQFKLSISCTTVLALLKLSARNTFTSKQAVAVPFRKSCKNALRLLVIKSLFWGRCSLDSKHEKKLPSVWSKWKRKRDSFENTIGRRLAAAERVDCAREQLRVPNSGPEVPAFWNSLVLYDTAEACKEVRGKERVSSASSPLSAEGQEEELSRAVGFQNIICCCLDHSETCSLFNMSSPSFFARYFAYKICVWERTCSTKHEGYELKIHFNFPIW